MPTIEHYTGPTSGSDCGRSNVYSTFETQYMEVSNNVYEEIIRFINE